MLIHYNSGKETSPSRGIEGAGWMLQDFTSAEWFAFLGLLAEGKLHYTIPATIDSGLGDVHKLQYDAGMYGPFPLHDDAKQIKQMVQRRANPDRQWLQDSMPERKSHPAAAQRAQNP